MGWGSHCDICGKEKCSWVKGPVCEGSLDQYLSSKDARIAALEAQLAEKERSEREIEYDVRSKIRLAFRRALSELPAIAPLEIRRVLSSVHMRDDFLNEGKRLQQIHGTDAVAPRVEQECGAGAWSLMRNGILTASGLIILSEADVKAIEDAALERAAAECERKGLPSGSMYATAIRALSRVISQRDKQ